MILKLSGNAPRAGLLTALLTVLVTTSSPALAHHAMDGAVPTTMLQGLLSGLAHPVIGFDHLAFVVAAGVAAALSTVRFLAPAVFVGATVAGCLLALGTGSFAYTEILVAASVALIGAILLTGRDVPASLLLALLGGAGMAHGFAYAGSIIGAEATPLGAYLTGFAVVQYVLAMAAAWITRDIWRAASEVALQPRLAGAVVAGVGATLLIEHVEKLVFPGL